jgi:hypothetical protein
VPVTLKETMQPPPPAGHPIAPPVLPLAATLRKIKSGPLSISVTGEHEVFAVLKAVVIALAAPITLLVIGIRVNVAFPPVFPHT